MKGYVTIVFTGSKLIKWLSHIACRALLRALQCPGKREREINRLRVSQAAVREQDPAQTNVSKSV